MATISYFAHMLYWFQDFLIVFTWIILFLYGLKSFSTEIQRAGADKLNIWLSKLTRHRWQAFGLGAIFTAVIQSSSAVSSMTVALVDAGAFSFVNSLAVLLGANVGTTTTAWLVSLKIIGIGPVFVVGGALLGFIPGRVHLIGKSLFYFGFILFTLQLLSDSLKPVQQSPEIIEMLRSAEQPLLAVLIGAVVTALVQSSSVVSGISVVMVSSGLIELQEGISIIIGSSIGTTSTAIIASLRMSAAARLTAFANLIFNVAGSLLFIPLIGVLADVVRMCSDDPAYQVAFAHLFFKLTVASIFLVILKPFARLLLRYRGQSVTVKD